MRLVLRFLIRSSKHRKTKRSRFWCITSKTNRDDILNSCALCQCYQHHVDLGIRCYSHLCQCSHFPFKIWAILSLSLQFQYLFTDRDRLRFEDVSRRVRHLISLDSGSNHKHHRIRRTVTLHTDPRLPWLVLS